MAVLAVAMLSASCFSPDYQEGRPCGPDNFCPPGQACFADQICRLEDSVDTSEVGAIATGGIHTCAVLTTGGVRCWGGAMLGYGDMQDVGDNETPASAGNVDVGAGVQDVALGFAHTCARLDPSGVRCWGEAESGRLGYGDLVPIGDDEVPATVGEVPIGASVSQLDAGGRHTCVTTSSGGVICWGRGEFGQLGYANTNNIGDATTPDSAGEVNVGGQVTAVATGGFHTCAILSDGSVRCWGRGAEGLGYGNTDDIGDNESPAAAGDVLIGGSTVQLAAGSVHTCALLNNDAVRCWGRGDEGQLGYGNGNDIGNDETPASAGDVDVGGAVTQITAGDMHTCALLDTGAVRCWGLGDDGQLGYGNTNSIGDNESPASAGDVDVGGPVQQIEAGAFHTCALLTSGAVRCWGRGDFGRLGYGNLDNIGDDENPASAGDVTVL